MGTGDEDFLDFLGQVVEEEPGALGCTGGGTGTFQNAPPRVIVEVGDGGIKRKCARVPLASAIFRD